MHVAQDLVKQGVQAPTAKTPTPPPSPDVVITPDGRVVVRSQQGSPSQILEAFRNQRSELRSQLERLEEQRDDLARQLRDTPNLSDADKKGLETRLNGLDQRIVGTEKQIAEADANVAAAAAIPGAVVRQPPPPPQSGPPEEFWVLSGIFMFVVLLPLTIAYARRIWRRGAGVLTSLPQEIYDRFNRLDQAVDAVAIEVERVGEGQRFLTRSMADQQRALGAGPAERVDMLEREREKQARK